MFNNLIIKYLIRSDNINKLQLINDIPLDTIYYAIDYKAIKSLDFLLEHFYDNNKINHFINFIKYSLQHENFTVFDYFFNNNINNKFFFNNKISELFYFCLDSNKLNSLIYFNDKYNDKYNLLDDHKDNLFSRAVSRKFIDIVKWFCNKFSNRYEIKIIDNLIIDYKINYLILNENENIYLDNILDCNICYEKSNIITNCNHQFCNECITIWLKNKNNCPYCRSKIFNCKLIKNNILI